MKKLLYVGLVLWLTVSLGCSSSSTNKDLEPVVVYKILPIGDSRVKGSPDGLGHQSYRYELWKLLVANQWTFDFIGPRQNSENFPDYLGKSFDLDQAGYGGATTATIISRLDEIISATGAPDIVLLGIGGNDLVLETPVDEVLANINTIIDRFQTLNPSVDIIVEQIAPGHSNFMTSEQVVTLADFHTKIAVLATQQSNTMSTVVVVDMATGWNDAYLFDSVHYTTLGASVVASRYYSALVALVN